MARIENTIFISYRRADVYTGGDPNASSDFGQKYRVLRGGSWKNFYGEIRSTVRYWYDPSYSDSNIGFHCATSATP